MTQLIDYCLHVCSQSEVSLRGYKAHLSGISAPAPLTEREEALKELQQSEHSTNYGTDSRFVSSPVFSCPIFFGISYFERRKGTFIKTLILLLLLNQLTWHYWEPIRQENWTT